MTPGLYIICVPSGYNPFVLVGWMAPVRGHLRPYSDEWEMRGGRVIKRFGANNAELGQLAAHGPQEGTQLLLATERECYHRLAIARAIPCDPEAWAEDCPQPEGWGG